MDSSDISTTNPMRCVICHHVSHGHHFGVQSCRACAAFFRRTVMENKVYKCKGNMKCAISKELRNMCRACRYSKCQQSGMNKNDIQFHREPIGHPQSEKLTFKVETASKHYSHGPQSTIMSSSCFHTHSNPIKLPKNYKPKPLETLERLQIGCNHYYYGQEDTPSSSNNDQNNGPSFTYITHAVVCQLEKDHVQLICKIVNDYFVPFDKLEKSTKKYVLHRFFVKHQLMETVYQTYQNAFILPNNSWILFNGYILNESNLGAVVPDTPIRHGVLQFVEQATKILKSMKKSIEQLEVDDLERAAMSGILLWQEVASAEPSWSEASDAQTTVFSELHTHVVQKVGISKAGSRIGALMSLINELEAVARVFLERETMEKVFDSQFSDAWESLEV